MLETSSAYKTSNWTNLTNAQCISAFQHQLVSSWIEVLVVVDSSANETLLSQYNSYTPGAPLSGSSTPVYSWMCQSSSCSPPPAASSWRIAVTDYPGYSNLEDTFYSVQNCYAKPAVEHCKVQFIPSLMAVVILCNVVKVICISKSFWGKGWSRSLVTIGGSFVPQTCFFAYHLLSRLAVVD
jgi:hypothetical protein